MTLRANNAMLREQVRVAHDPKDGLNRLLIAARQWLSSTHGLLRYVSGVGQYSSPPFAANTDRSLPIDIASVAVSKRG